MRRENLEVDRSCITRLSQQTGVGGVSINTAPACSEARFIMGPTMQMNVDQTLTKQNVVMALKPFI